MKGGLSQRPNTGTLRAQLSPACAHRICLWTSSHQASSPWSRAQLFLESPMMDGEERSVTWLCNRSLFGEHKKCATVSTACWIPKIPFYFLFSVYDLWGREEPEGTGEERKFKDSDNKKTSLSWKQNTKNFSTNHIRHKTPALQCWHPPLHNIKEFRWKLKLYHTLVQCLISAVSMTEEDDKQLLNLLSFTALRNKSLLFSFPYRDICQKLHQISLQLCDERQ